ncbi:MAG: ABC transporter ATP-binding protein [Microthrixaceae bacterium]
MSDPTPVPALVCEGVSLRFGGITALDKVAMRVEPGEIVGLIGMNGAGKSTLLNCVSGLTRPAAGTIAAYGVDVTHAPPDFRTDLGIARTFQGGKLFPAMTVVENIEVALERRRATSSFTAMLALPWGRRAERWKEDEAERLLVLLGLTGYADKFVRELSTGTRRVVEIAALLAQRPRLVLMDEPAAGVAQRETEVLVLLLQQLRDELDCAIVLVEHDMPLVMAVCDHVYAMEAGRVIADGPPAEVQSNPLVVAGYLGEDRAAIERSDSVAGPASGRRARGRHAPLATGPRLEPAAAAAVSAPPTGPQHELPARKALVLSTPAVALALFVAMLSTSAPDSVPAAKTDDVAAPTTSPLPVSVPSTTTTLTTLLAAAPLPPSVPTTSTSTTTTTSTSTTTTTTTTTTTEPPPPGGPVPVETLCFVLGNGPVSIPQPVPCP